MKLTLTQLIQQNAEIGKVISVHLYNKARLTLTLCGVLKQESVHGQFYIRTEHFFLIFSDNGYDYYRIASDKVNNNIARTTIELFIN